MKSLNYGNRPLLAYKGFKFFKTLDRNKEADKWLKIMHEEIEMFSSMIMNYYMRPMHVYSIDSINVSNAISLKNNPKKLFDMIRRVKHMVSDPVVRIDTVYGSTYIDLMNYGCNSSDKSEITFTIINTTPEFIRFRSYRISESGLVVRDPIYLGENSIVSKLNDDLDKSYFRFENPENSDFWIEYGIIYGAINKLRNNIEDNKTRNLDPYMLKWLPNVMAEETKNTEMINAISFIISHKINDALSASTERSNINLINKKDDDVLDSSNWGQYPLVDLGDKEYRFIDKYIKENINLFSENKYIDLNKYMGRPMFGNKYRFYIDEESKDDETYLVSYEINENNEITFRISKPLKNGALYLIEVTAINADKFNFRQDIKEILMSLVVDQKSKTLPNYDQISKELPSWMENPKNLWAAILLFIEIIIVIHDRPKRTKCVAMTKSKESKENNDNMKSKISSSKGGNEKDYVIKRILMTASAAKSLISSKTGTRGPVEYVIESWTRSGHWRTYQSGKRIWIGEATCNRHQPMSTKEIHIKL